MKRLHMILAVVALGVLIGCKSSESTAELNGKKKLKRNLSFKEGNPVPDKIIIEGTYPANMDLKILARKISSSDWPEYGTNECYPRKLYYFGTHLGFKIGEDRRSIKVARIGNMYQAEIDFSVIEHPQKCRPMKVVHMYTPHPIKGYDDSYFTVGLYERGYNVGGTKNTIQAGPVKVECTTHHYLDLNETNVACPIHRENFKTIGGFTEFFGGTLSNQKRYKIDFISDSLLYKMKSPHRLDHASKLKRLNEVRELLDSSSVSKDQKKRLKEQEEDLISELKFKISRSN